MRQIVYVSTARSQLSEQVVTELLRRARHRNAMAGITGALLHHGFTLMQAIEGPAQPVAELFERIRGDRRHRGLITLLDQRCKQRDFADSPMASGPNARQLSAHWLPGHRPLGVAGAALAWDARRLTIGLMDTFMPAR